MITQLKQNIKHHNGFAIFSDGSISGDVVTRTGGLILFDGIEHEHMQRTGSVPPSLRAVHLKAGREHWQTVFEKDDEARDICGSEFTPRTAEDIEWLAQGYADIQADRILHTYGFKPLPAATNNKSTLCDVARLPHDLEDLPEAEQAAAWEAAAVGLQENAMLQTPAVIPPFDLSRLVTGAQIHAGDYPVTWVCGNTIPNRAIVLVYGKGGCGKTTITRQIANAVQHGLDFMGLPTIKRQVVIIDYENPPAVLKQGIGAVNPDTEILYWTINAEPPQLDQPEWESLKSLVVTLKDPLLIFDTLPAACCSLDINSNADYAPIMHRAKQLRELGATIVFLHHTPKSDDTKYVGASVIYNQCDHIIAMFPVKQAGTEKEAADDDDTAKVYRFGSKDKTRFAHHKIYVQFDEDKKLFVKSEGPDVDAIKILQDAIIDFGAVNQSTLLASDTVSTLVGKSVAKRLLKTFSGTHWNAQKGMNNAIFYTPISGRKTARQTALTVGLPVCQSGQNKPENRMNRGLLFHSLKNRFAGSSKQVANPYQSGLTVCFQEKGCQTPIHAVCRFVPYREEAVMKNRLPTGILGRKNHRNKRSYS